MLLEQLNHFLTPQEYNTSCKAKSWTQDKDKGNIQYTFLSEKYIERDSCGAPDRTDGKPNPPRKGGLVRSFVRKGTKQQPNTDNKVSASTRHQEHKH